MIQRFKALRETDDAQLRGYAFEQYVRESLPWSFRPPIAVVAKSEQMDAFFEFNSWHFLVECKAKESHITPGSRDWEDFELKIRRRGGSCIGLFCSLWPVSDQIYEAADNLNRSHHTTIIISGDQWDDLENDVISYDDLLRFLVSEARSQYRTKVARLAEIQDRILRSANVELLMRSSLQSSSSTFLRRHRAPRHEKIYVPRALDRDIAELLEQLAPSRLAKTHKRSRHKDREVEHARTAPHQIAIIRDLSGAGKTTLSVELSNCSEHFTIVKAAVESDIDSIGDSLSSLGVRHGIAQFIQVNKPILYIVDSLDEATLVGQKRNELKAIFQILNSLNTEAVNRGLLCFPLLILLTVRDEYWRDWESQVEGRRARIFTRRFSRFSEKETQTALQLYQNAYHYNIVGTISTDLLDALSHPFTLLIYSEANEFLGDIDASQHFGSRVFTLFFDRKKEDLLKRPVLGLDGDVMMRICSEVAIEMVISSRPEINDAKAAEIIRSVDPLLSARTDSITRTLKSEQIFSATEKDSKILRFRHGRFLEYLIAYRIFLDITCGHVLLGSDRACNLDSYYQKTAGQPISYVGARSLGRDISSIYESISNTAFASPYVIFEYLRSLASQDEVTLARLRDAIAVSQQFMESFLVKKRAEIADGGDLIAEDARAITVSMGERDARLCWDGYFVLTAARARQSKENIRHAFMLVWDTNQESSDLYKVIPKIAKHGLLFNEDVVRRIWRCRDPKCWLSFLEQVSITYANEFLQLWHEMNGADFEREISSLSDYEWCRVRFLLNYMKIDGRYPLGEI